MGVAASQSLFHIFQENATADNSMTSSFIAQSHCGFEGRFIEFSSNNTFSTENTLVVYITVLSKPDVVSLVFLLVIISQCQGCRECVAIVLSFSDLYTDIIIQC